MTLVEILTAMMVSVILLGTAFSTFWAAIQAWEKSKRRSDMIRLLEGAGQMITRQLRAMQPPFLEGNPAFIAINDSDESGDFDSICFLSSANPRFPRELDFTDLCEIEIYIETEESGQETGEAAGQVSEEGTAESASVGPGSETQRTPGGLWIRMDATPDDDLESGGYLIELGAQITSLNFLFFDGYEWLEEWYDDTQVPEAIELSLTVTDPLERENPMTLTRLVTIPIATAINDGTLVGVSPTESSSSTSGTLTGSSPTGSTGGQSGGT